MDWKKPDPNIVKRFSAFSTSTLSDALDKLDIRGGCLGIIPAFLKLKMVGTAYTVRYVPLGGVKGTVGDYVDRVSPGDVVVLDNNGRMDCTVWGDILTVTAKLKGISGTIIDGVFRDMPTILEEQYPIFSRGRFMMTGKDRVMVQAEQEIVSIGGVQIKPGDIIVGDDSGVVSIPQEVALKVLEIANAVSEAEENIVKAVRDGLSLAEAREKFKYHSLQTKNKP